MASDTEGHSGNGLSSLCRDILAAVKTFAQGDPSGVPDAPAEVRRQDILLKLLVDLLSDVDHISHLLLNLGCAGVGYGGGGGEGEVNRRDRCIGDPFVDRTRSSYRSSHG